MDHQRTQQQNSKSHQRHASSTSLASVAVTHERQSLQKDRPFFRQELYVRNSSFESPSTDHEEDEDDEDDYEISFLEACMDCDDDALYEIIRNGVTKEQINEMDKSGRTGLSHASANGFLPILELLGSLDDLDSNLADKDGNTSLIYAAQAGHDDVVNVLLQNMRNVRVDQSNKMGFTALMKAAIQGRTRCAKLLLFAGASPNKRDHGRGLCAEEWARFCGCHSCANSISKYVRSKKYFFKKTFILSKDKWSSEPDIFNCSRRGGISSNEKPSSWIQRHLSLKKRKGREQSTNKNLASLETGSALASANKFGSAPILLINSYDEELDRPTMNLRRPSCIDNVVPVSIGRRRQGQPIDECEDSNEDNRIINLNRNSPPTNHEGFSESQNMRTKNQEREHNQERPPKITVGDLVGDDTQQLPCTTETPNTSTSAIVAPSLTLFFPGKAVAVTDSIRHSSDSRRGSADSRQSSCSQDSQTSTVLTIRDI